ncbi:MAG: hypothetical protein N3C57_05530 [Aquificaceae bacterium]|nr:hypothetical protein [Aquificaceae bacterium]
MHDFIERDWEDYNRGMVRRREILVDLKVFDTQPQHNQTKK